MVDELKNTCQGCPKLPEKLPEALDSFCKMPKADPSIWGMARLPEVFSYLRGSKRLRIPPDWRPFVPLSIED